MSNNKIVFAQLNPISGDVEYNKNKAIEYIKRAKAEKAGLIIFPELFLIGYPIGDILTRYPSLLKQTQKALDEVKKHSDNISILIGYPQINKDKIGKPYYNSVSLIKDGEIKKTVRKTLLANYSEHNDYRYFEPYFKEQNRIFELNGVKYGIIICEDGWNDFDFFCKNLYNIDPVQEIADKIDCLICLASSCTRAKKEQLKHNMMKFVSKKYKIKYIYVNQVGANDELIYDGLSRIYDENGEIIARAKAFEEDFFVVDDFKGKINPLPTGLEKTLDSQKEFSLDYEADLDRTYQSIILSIKEYFSKNGIKRAVLGLSGGLDSTICATLLADAIGNKNVIGVSMPSKITSSESKNDAKELAQNLGINFLEIPIKQECDVISNKFSDVFKKIDLPRYQASYTNDNIQARLRATILWGISNEFESTIPIATSDKSELYMGYATINGDMSGGFAPITDVVKTKLFALARWMNENRLIKNSIPISIIKKPPGAELAINPETGKPLLAEEALMPYEFLDEIIWRLENFSQSIDNMMEEKFLYETKHQIDEKTKLMWLNKFFKRLNRAIYKWYIAPIGPIVDSRSINKQEFKQPVVSNIDYK